MRDALVILSREQELAGLVARTLRGQQFYCTLLPFDAPLETVMADEPRGIILAAGSQNDAELTGLDERLLSAGVPVLALGAITAALCVHFGGQAEASVAACETVTMSLAQNQLFDGMDGGESVLCNPRYLVLPPDYAALCTATERVVGFQHPTLPLYAVQYVIERNDPDAAQLLHNFAHLICGASPDWDEDSIIAQAIEDIRAVAGDGRVMCAVSGGVDSAVCAKLAHMAVENRLICVFVDTGLFRREEPHQVIESYMETLGLVVAYVDAQDTFSRALAGVRSAKEKERIAASLLQQVLYNQLTFEPDIHTLVLGTNFNDSLYGRLAPLELPATINDVPLRVVEPIRNLFKDEVRRLAISLSLPGTIAERQPFPASGLAQRIFGEVTPDRLDILRAADSFFSEEIRACGHERKLWQYYATLSEDPDDRTGYAVVLRAVQAAHHSAYAARLPYDLLERVTEHILAEIPGVSRVVYDLTPSKHYSTLE